MKDLSDLIGLLLMVCMALYAVVGLIVGITWPLWLFFRFTMN